MLETGVDHDRKAGRPPRPEDFRQSLPRKRTLEPGNDAAGGSGGAPGTPEIMVPGPSRLPEALRPTLEPGKVNAAQVPTPPPTEASDDLAGPTMLGIGPDAGEARPLGTAETVAGVDGAAPRGSKILEAAAAFDEDQGDDPRIGAVLRGYELRSRIGDGAMGVVYLGKHVDIGKEAAVKVLRASLSHRREVVERFLQEARAASRIDSPHVVGITDFGETDDGAPFFIMELLRGETLGERMLVRERMPWAELRRILEQVLRALAAAHAQGIVHRDMKPDNIMLADTSHGELVKVLDFGIAKVIDEGEQQGEGDLSKITRTGMIVGTAAYMSPEQAQSQPLDTRADIYSVGVIAYQAVTGRLPFDEDGFMPMVLAHATKQPPAPSEALRTGMFSSSGATEIDDLIMKALAKSPDDRFQSAEEMRAAILAIDDSTDVAPSEGTSQRAYQIIAGVALALVLAMIAWLTLT